MRDHTTLRAASDDELLRRLIELVSQSRSNEADLVAHIGEVERRRLYAREAAPSMFAYCRQRLHLSEAEAYMRIRVARASRRHPVLLEMLQDGRLHLSAIVRLLPVLTLENRDGLLVRATHASKRRILELVAELSPRPDVPARLRKLPEAVRVAPVALCLQAVARKLCPDTVPASSTESSAPMADLEQSSDRPTSSFELGVAGNLRGASGPSIVENPRPVRRTDVEPLSPGRYKVQFTASAELRDKLERLQALMRFQMPDGDLAAVIEAAVSEKLQRLESRRFAKRTTPRMGIAKEAGAAQSRPATPTQPTIQRLSRYIPAELRRAVYARDAGRCRYVDKKGRRCSEQHRLEYHHHHPYGLGGGHELAEIRLMCRSHNLLLAEQDYGTEAMARHRRSI